MKATKRILSLLLVCAMLFALAACANPQDSTTVPTTTGNNVSSDKGTYTVKLTTAGGMALAGYQVLIYADKECTDSVDAGTTDDNGSVKFSLKKGGEYYIQLNATALKGYDVKDYYEFDGTTANLTLTSSVIEGENPASKTFKLGDVMYDFTFEDNTKIVCAACGVVSDIHEPETVIAEDGTESIVYVNREKCTACEEVFPWGDDEFVIDYPEITLSEVLAEKDLVMLNFWYATCSACIAEFPVLDKSFQNFAENVAVFGVNSYPSDTAGTVTGFQQSYQLSFPLGKVDSNFNPQRFIDPLTNIPCGGYPISVFVDRYGVITLIHMGNMTSLTEWNSVFSHFVGDDYEQKLVKSAEELITRLEPTVDNPPVEDIHAAFTGNDGVNVTYRWEDDPEDSVYAWPFLVGEKEGETCLYASNTGIYESFAIMYAEVQMEKGDVLAFDYWASSEKDYDVLHVIVDNEAVYSLSGLNEGWQTAYCWIADETRTYELALCYQKDTDDNTVKPGDQDKIEDNVYLKNLRTVAIEDIDAPSYLPRQAANKNEDGTYNYVNIVLNEQDGYYHVGSVDGPLLLAGLYVATQFSETEAIFNWSFDDEIDKEDGPYGYASVVEYFSAAINSNLQGWCTVTEELAEYLKVVANVKGYLEDENEWMLFCKYYDAYGTDGKQLEDPVAGLKKWSALTATEGKDIETNHFYYNGIPLVPQGKLARFTPEKSGAYRITSSTNYTDSLYGWIFVDEQDDYVYQYQHEEMLSYQYCDNNNVTMVFYMEAGKSYYINIAPYNNYDVCDIWYDIEFLGETYEYFRACSPGAWFTTEDEGVSMDEDNLIIIGMDAALNPEDGYYHEVLERDENGNPVRFGSIVYAYFGGSTPLFSDPIADVYLYNEDGTPKLDEVTGEHLFIKGMISKGGFNFTYSADDEQILHYLKLNNNDQEATLEYINGLPTEYEMEIILDVFEGKYHGLHDSDYIPVLDANGNHVNYDVTAKIQTYLDKMISDSEHPELEGCVPVDAELMQMLQWLVDKYSFTGVEDAWQKLCFYYDYMG